MTLKQKTNKLSKKNVRNREGCNGTINVLLMHYSLHTENENRITRKTNDTLKKA